MTLRLGIIGQSPGNGHPYSWAAIFNGYDAEAMATCPFPSIPQYLAEQRFPDASLGDLARVTHIWAQSTDIATHVAKASKITTVCSRLEDMVDHVDGILLARDDAERHLEHALPFLEAGLPIYIDKPAALSVAALEDLLARQRCDWQIFTCSALRYARELVWNPAQVGTPRYIHAMVPKYWDTYSVHALEPIVAQLPSLPWRHADTRAHRMGTGSTFDARVGELHLRVVAAGSLPSEIRIDVLGELGFASCRFADSFSAFRSALQEFATSINSRVGPIPRDQTRDIVHLIEAGRLP